MAFLRETGKRTKSLHLRNTVGGVWAETLGEGDIDYSQVKAVLDEIGYHGPLIAELALEAKTPRNRPLAENQRLSRQYIKKIFAV